MTPTLIASKMLLDKGNQVQTVKMRRANRRKNRRYGVFNASGKSTRPLAPIAPRGSERLQEALGGSERLREAPRGSRRLPEAPREA